ncbi:MAG: heparan-alpha-glucosaminide N-acetyltransferase [Sporomusaceae bacterium]|nr:heparan-alpha-glucosaminide N-acetyltransferase [Sporomusaceae bacterium]
MRQRIWEIDYLRGTAIILMVIFHLVVDLTDFYGFQMEYLSGFWYYLGKVSAVLFMLLAGGSSVLNRKPLPHGVRILAAAVLVSAVTYWFLPAAYVRFGILHLLGTCICLSAWLRRLPAWGLLLLAVAMLALPYWLDGLAVESGLLLPLGITPAVFSSIDYYPLIPWLGVFLLGLLAGRRLYSRPQPRLRQWPGTKGICWLGRRSLLIYLLHQPVLLASLYLLSTLLAVMR